MSRDSADRNARTLPPQHQRRQPGIETRMRPLPSSGMEDYVGSAKLQGKVALITGGDSGIGRAVAIDFAKEGADCAIVYLDEHDDAQRTQCDIEATGRQCVTMAGDVGDERFCHECVDAIVRRFGRLDILVNNAAEQHPRQDISAITADQLERVFRSNVFSMFYLVKAALPHLQRGARVINTTSVTAYRGSPELLDYSATKGAIVAFTRSLSLALVDQGIIVNAVAPGPI